MYNNEAGPIEYCALCDKEIYIESYAEEFKWIDGLGYLCSDDMNLDKFSSEDEESDNVYSLEDLI